MKKEFLTIRMIAIVASIGLTTITSNTEVFAQGGPPGLSVPPNTWGGAASGLGQSGQMGGHASNPGEVDPQPGREGLGNVLDPQQPNSPGAKHPSNLPGALCPPGSTNPLCQ